MHCPTCKITDSDNDRLARYPDRVRTDLSRFVDCAAIFSTPGIFRCANCGGYLRANPRPGEIKCLDPLRLREVLNPSLCPRFGEVLSFPPDLFRVAANELKLGNETIEVIETDSQMVLLALRYRFLDGHIVSSWIEYQEIPTDERWCARYLCSSAQAAIACGHSDK